MGVWGVMPTKASLQEISARLLTIGAAAVWSTKRYHSIETRARNAALAQAGVLAVARGEFPVPLVDIAHVENGDVRPAQSLQHVFFRRHDRG